jgi:hypothetical protein
LSGKKVEFAKISEVSDIVQKFRKKGGFVRKKGRVCENLRDSGYPFKSSGKKEGLSGKKVEFTKISEIPDICSNGFQIKKDP